MVDVLQSPLCSVLNGIWLVGNATMEWFDAKVIHQTMSKDYRVAEYPEITALTPKVEEILKFGAE